MATSFSEAKRTNLFTEVQKEWLRAVIMLQDFSAKQPGNEKVWKTQGFIGERALPVPDLSLFVSAASSHSALLSQPFWLQATPAELRNELHNMPVLMIASRRL